MDRNALLIYLHDLRDLEAAKYQIKKIQGHNYDVSKSEISAIDDKEKYKMIPEKDYVEYLVLGSVFSLLTLLCFLLSTTTIQEGDFGYSISLLYREAQKWMCQQLLGLFREDFNFLFVLWSGVLSVVLIAGALSKYINYKKNYFEAKKHNEEHSC